MKLCEISKKYNRDSSSVIGLLRKMGEFEPLNKRWSKDEIEMLKRNYSSLQLDELVKIFPGRKISDIHSKASALKLQRYIYHWSNEDLEFLKANYMKYSSEELYNIFKGRYSICSIRSKGRNFKIANHTNYWSEEENEIIRNHYSILPISKVKEMLPERTENAIALHASNLGILSYHTLNEHFSDDQRKYIIENWMDKTDEEIAVLFSKSKNAIRDQRYKIGLLKCNKDYSGYECFDKIFRGQIYEWKEQSMKSCNYSCILTGSKDFAVHHIISYNTILHEAYVKMEELGFLKSKHIDDYSMEEIKNLIYIFKEIHSQYPLGVCVKKNIHKLFHKIYGSGRNNKNQWENFCQKYKEGVYK